MRRRQPITCWKNTFRNFSYKIKIKATESKNKIKVEQKQNELVARRKEIIPHAREDYCSAGLEAIHSAVGPCSAYHNLRTSTTGEGKEERRKRKISINMF